MQEQRIMIGGEFMCRTRCYNCGVTELKDLRYICSTPGSAQWEIISICPLCKQFYIINRSDPMGGGFDYIKAIDIQELDKIFK